MEESQEAMRESQEVKLYSPWVRYVNRLKALFEQDPDVEVGYDDETHVVTVRVTGEDKATALSALLPVLKEFGNVTLEIRVIPSNEEPTEEKLYHDAFSGNPLFVDLAGGYGPNRDITYALFAKGVVQVREDDISEFMGYTTLTCAELAKSVLEPGSLLISTAR